MERTPRTTIRTDPREFLHRIRRATDTKGLFVICEEYLNHDQPMPLEPFDLELKPRDVLAGEHR